MAAAVDLERYLPKQTGANGTSRVVLVFGPTWITCVDARPDRYAIRSVVRTGDGRLDLTEVAGTDPLRERSPTTIRVAILVAGEDRNVIEREALRVFGDRHLEVFDRTDITISRREAIFCRTEPGEQTGRRRSFATRVTLLATLVIAGLTVGRIHDVRRLDARRDQLAERLSRLDEEAHAREVRLAAFDRAEALRPIDPYIYLERMFPLLGNDVAIESLTFAEDAITVFVIGGDPYMIGQRIDRSPWFGSVRVGQITRTERGEYRYSVETACVGHETR
jgi:hypothetical protein